jgi:hypothetical protein
VPQSLSRQERLATPTFTRRQERFQQWTLLLARTPFVAALYTAIAVVMTWPIARDLGTRLASDLYDPAFNCWVLAWTTGQLLQALRGDLSALTNFWNANIFYPEPLTLAYSEHLFGQALQVLPIQAVTGNVLLSYNLLFISTFALSGFAVYVLVRDLTERPLAAFVAGLAFAYAPYRLGQISHLQVLSSYWMPLALVGFRRYFVRVAADGPSVLGSRALAGGALATAMQSLSCGYYMLFFAPFAALYCLYEMVQRRLLGQWRVWLQLALAAIVVALITWPFAWAYFQLRDIAGLGVRSVEDLVQFSADTYSFATPPRRTRILAQWLDGYSKPEGAGFPGLTILVLATIGVIWNLRRTVLDLGWASLRDWHAAAIVWAAAALSGSTALLAWFFVQGRVGVRLGSRFISYSDASVVLAVFLVSLGLTFILTSVIRGRNAASSVTAFGFFVMATIGAALLAMGPEIQVLGRRISEGPYLWLFEHVPGFDGLRVPARYLMLVALFLSVLAGLGAAALATLRQPVGPILMLVASAGILAEGWAVPMPMNGGGRPRPDLVAGPPPSSGSATPAIYQFIRDLSGPIALLELPFGDPAYEVMAVFYAGHHRKPIVNGYSGWFPRNYRRNVGPLRDVLEDPDRALRALGRSQATHVLVHEAAWPSSQGQQVSAWLVSLGASPVTASGADRLFELPKIAVSPE